jgi:sulfate adenylyltransferase subunit 2
MYQEENEEMEERIVRFRTVGDMSCTAAVDSMQQQYPKW